MAGGVTQGVGPKFKPQYHKYIYYVYIGLAQNKVTPCLSESSILKSVHTQIYLKFQDHATGQETEKSD
jgi:hypothetical protein